MYLGRKYQSIWMYAYLVIFYSNSVSLKKHFASEIVILLEFCSNMYWSS